VNRVWCGWDNTGTWDYLKNTLEMSPDQTPFDINFPWSWEQEQCLRMGEIILTLNNIQLITRVSNLDSTHGMGQVDALVVRTGEEVH
jgi:hypothetical protein